MVMAGPPDLARLKGRVSSLCLRRTRPSLNRYRAPSPTTAWQVVPVRHRHRRQPRSGAHRLRGLRSGGEPGRLRALDEVNDDRTQVTVGLGDGSLPGRSVAARQQSFERGGELVAVSYLVKGISGVGQQ